MARKKKLIPEYGKTLIKGVEYYRTRIEDADGKRVSLYALTAEELYDKVEEAKQLIKEAKFRRSTPTVKEYCEKWLLMQSANIRVTTLNDYRSKVKNYIIAPLGHKYMAEVTPDDVRLANLTLPNGGIDIPAQGYMQHKKVLPLYSLYLRNQTGYANNYYVAYCIEPGVELANSGGHDGTAYTVNDMVDGSGALYRINRDQVEAIGIALLYGQKEIASKKDEQTLRYEKLCRHAATQAIVWELACGWRSPYPPYTLWDTTLFDAITPSLYCASSVWGTNFYLDGMDDAYLDIQAKMQQHYVSQTWNRLP